MRNWNDFNDGNDPVSKDLIPGDTYILARLQVKPGGYDDAEIGLTGGYATRSEKTGSIFLSTVLVSLDQRYPGREVPFLYGIRGKNGDAWGKMGRDLLRATLNSAQNIAPNDNSPAARAARCINDFGGLDGLEFVVCIDQEQDSLGNWRNIVKRVIEPGHPAYAAAREAAKPSPLAKGATQRSVTAPSAAAGRPSWA